MEPENLTVRILTEMRDELRAVKDEVHQINGHVAAMDERMGLFEDALLDSVSQIRVLGRATRVSLDARRRHETLIADIDRRVTEIERERGER